MKMRKKLLFILVVSVVFSIIGCPILNYTVNATTTKSTEVKKNTDNSIDMSYREQLLKEVYNPDYIRYMKLSDEEKEKCDVIPPKYNVPQKDSFKYRGDNYKKNIYGSQIIEMSKLLKDNALPSSYDLRTVLGNKGIKIKVEDQGQNGVCWAFASLGALRLHVAVKDIATETLSGNQTYNKQTVDLSEQHLNILSSNLYPEKYNSKRSINANNGGDVSGNFDIAALNYYKLNDGPVREKNVPYSGQNCIDKNNQNFNINLNTLSREDTTVLNKLDELEPVLYVHSAELYPTYTKIRQSNGDVQVYAGGVYDEEENLLDDLGTNSDRFIKDTEMDEIRNDIKQSIISNGGLYAHIRVSDANFSAYRLGEAEQCSSNEEIHAHYDDGTCKIKDVNYTIAEHAVTIIGWDDSFPKTKFHSKDKNGNKVVPEHDGAYLILNSYGEGNLDGGYMWVSYDDYAIDRVISAYTSVDTQIKNQEFTFTDETVYNAFKNFAEGEVGNITANDSTKTVSGMDIIFNSARILDLTDSNVTSADMAEITKYTMPLMNVLYLSGNKIDDLSFFDNLPLITGADLSNQDLRYTIGKNENTFEYPEIFQHAVSERSDLYSEQGIIFVGCRENDNHTGIILENNYNSGVAIIKSGPCAGTRMLVTKGSDASQELPKKLHAVIYQTEYNLGDKVDHTKIVVTATYNDDSQKILNPTEYDTNYEYFTQAGDSIPLKISCGTLLVQLNVKVNPATITKVFLLAPTKFEYLVGETIDLEGGKLFVDYSNGNMANLDLDEPGITITDFDTSTTGIKTVHVSYEGNTQDFQILVSEPNTQLTVTEIKLTPPTKTTYSIGEELDKTGGEIEVTYSNGNKATIGLNAEGVTITGFDTTTAATNKTVTVAYKGQTATFTIDVIEPETTLEEITATTSKNVYYVGDSLDRSKITVVAKMSDNSTKTLNANEYEADVTTFNEAGQKTVTITYKNKTATFNVTVNEVTITQVTLTPPTKTEYEIGDSLDLTGGKLTVKYNNGDTKNINLTDTASGVTVSQLDSTTAGTKTITVTYKNNTKTFDVVVKSPAVTITQMRFTAPTKKQYYVGESLDITGGKITLVYSNGQTKNLDLDAEGVEISGFDSTTTGTKTITVKYNNKTVTFDVTVSEPEGTVQSIELTPPTKINYLIGESLDKTGGEIEVTYSNGNKATIDLNAEGVTITGFDTTTVATNKTVTVGYKGHTATFTIDVIEPETTLEEITATTSKNVYYVGDSLDRSKITVVAKMSDNSTKTLNANEYEADVTTFNEAGQKTVTITYQNKTATFNVTVNEVTITQVTLTPPTKTEYEIGDSLDLTGGKLTVKYNNGQTKNIDLTDTASGVTVSQLDSTTAGTKTITVTYKDNTKTFDVLVKSAEVTIQQMKLTPPTKTQYFVGQSLDLTGGKITLVYSNGESEEISLTNTNVKITGFDSTTAGTKTVTVTYNNKSATFEATVSKIELVSIKVSTKPTNLNYYQGDELDLTGLILEGTYSDGSKSDIKSGYSANVQKLNSTGRQTITVSYNGKTTTFEVNVVEKTNSGNNSGNSSNGNQGNSDNNNWYNNYVGQYEADQNDFDSYVKQNGGNQGNNASNGNTGNSGNSGSSGSNGNYYDDDSWYTEYEEDDSVENGGYYSRDTSLYGDDDYDSFWDYDDEYSKSNVVSSKGTTGKTTQKVLETSDKEISKTGYVGMGAAIVALIGAAAIFFKKYRDTFK